MLSLPVGRTISNTLLGCSEPWTTPAAAAVKILENVNRFHV